MALAAEAEPAFGRGKLGVNDRTIAELGRDGDLVKSSGTVTAFTADAAIARLRPRPIENRSRVGRVAKQASLDSVNDVERFTEEVASSACVGRVPGRPDPTRISTGLKVG